MCTRKGITGCPLSRCQQDMALMYTYVLGYCTGERGFDVR